VDVPAQSVLVVHWTQVDVARSQWAAGVTHCASDAQPGRHLNVLGSQTGAVPAQSEFERHATHAPCETRQRGLLAGQSPFEAHSTHSCVVRSHTLVSPEQSVDELQPTQAPVLVSQSRLSPGQDALLVHAAWQVWLAG
jgi:hypothetical protein